MELPTTPSTVAELAALGVTPKRLRLMTESGELRRLSRGVYIAARSVDEVGLRAAAIARAAPRDHVIVGRTAAWVHGVDTFGYAEKAGMPPIETAAPSRGASTRAGVDGHKRQLLDADITVVDGLRVTTTLRTGLDLGCCLLRREAFAAMVGLARAGGLTAADYLAELPRFEGRRGVRQLRALAPVVDPRIESHRECWVYLALHDAGLPLPEPQVWIEVDGVPTYRLDFGYREHRIAIEYDGEEFHGPDDEEYDAARRAWLRSHGWTVIVLRRGDFTGTRERRWLRRVGEALKETYSTRRW